MNSYRTPGIRFHLSLLRSTRAPWGRFTSGDNLVHGCRQDFCRSVPVIISGVSPLGVGARALVADKMTDGALY